MWAPKRPPFLQGCSSGSVNECVGVRGGGADPGVECSYDLEENRQKGEEKREARK